jgi:hypothetical protein
MPEARANRPKDHQALPELPELRLRQASPDRRAERRPDHGPSAATRPASTLVDKSSENPKPRRRDRGRRGAIGQWGVDSAGSRYPNAPAHAARCQGNFGRGACPSLTRSGHLVPVLVAWIWHGEPGSAGTRVPGSSRPNAPRRRWSGSPAFEHALLISVASGVRSRRHDWESTWPSSRCRFQVSHLVVH